MAPNAKVRSALSRKAGSSPSGPPMTRAQAGAPASRHSPSFRANSSLVRLRPRSSRQILRARRRNQRGERRRLLGLAVFRPAGARFVDLAHFEAGEADFPSAGDAALGVTRDQFALRAGFQPPDAGEQQFHRRRKSSLGPFLGRAVDAPHFFEIVEGPHFRAKQMDDDVACVDQHPVAGGQALDRRRRRAAFFQRLDRPVGQAPT